MRIEIGGVPQALKRHRTNHGKVYDPSKKEKEKFAWKVKTILAGISNADNLKVLNLEYHFEIPKSWSKKKKKEKLYTLHTSKPDLSNLIKFTEDALNGILYKDDSQIAYIIAKKVWSDSSKTILILPLEASQ